MTLELVVEHTAESVILFDVEKGTLDFNPAMAETLGTARQAVPLDTLRNLEANTAFIALLTRVTAEEKSPKEALIDLQLPGQDSPKKVGARVLPYKDRNEGVTFVIVFGRLHT
jgi:nitrogen-specific signal transduction histidine kinase